MPRQLKLKTREMGDLELFLIYQYGNTLESGWEGLEQDAIWPLLTKTTVKVMEEALHGFTFPLVSTLGIPPSGALFKVPVSVCEARGTCPFYAKNECDTKAKKPLPFCFDPAWTEGEDRKKLVNEIVRMWKVGVYVLVVSDQEA